MNYYSGNIPPPEKEMYLSSGQYPAGGTYLPTQSGLPPGPAQQPGYPQMSQQQYASMQPTYPPTSAYASVQAGYPVCTAPGGTPGAFHTVGFSSLPSLSSPTYVGSQGYPASAYAPGQLPTSAAYAPGQLPPSASPLYQGSAYSALHMSQPAGPGRGYPMHMYPASAYGASVYPAGSPYGQPYP